MESWHSVVLRRRADIAMEWATQRNEQMAAVYHKLREDHEDIKREGAKPGLGWGEVREEGPVEYWPATDQYCQGQWVEGLERSLAKEGWGWEDGCGIQKWRDGDDRLSAITGVKQEDVGFSGVAKSDLWKRGFKFRSELIGPDGCTVLPWGELPGWTGWLPPHCSKTSPERRRQMIWDHAQQLGMVEEWPALAEWECRLSCGEHAQGLGVGSG